MKIKSFECPKSIRNYEKNNAWNMLHLVDESVIPLTQRASVLHILKIVGFYEMNLIYDQNDKQIKICT